jgi:hypothetical protein
MLATPKRIPTTLHTLAHLITQLEGDSWYHKTEPINKNQAFTRIEPQFSPLWYQMVQVYQEPSISSPQRSNKSQVSQPSKQIKSPTTQKKAVPSVLGFTRTKQAKDRFRISLPATGRASSKGHKGQRGVQQGRDQTPASFSPLPL